MEILSRVSEFVMDKIDEWCFVHKAGLKERPRSELMLMEELYRLKFEREQESAFDSRKIATRMTLLGVPVAAATGINSFLIPSIVFLGWGFWDEIRLGYSEYRYQKVLKRVREVSVHDE